MAEKRWIALVHLFDEEGNYLKTEAKTVAKGVEGRKEASIKGWEALREMGYKLGFQDAEFCDVEVKLFSVTIDEVIHALEYGTDSSYFEEGDDPEECDYVMFWPMDIMFDPPWDSGDYST